MLNLTIDTDIFDYSHIPLPPVWTVRHHLPAPVLNDIVGATRTAMDVLFADPRLRPGANVAVGVGSRGVTNIVMVVRAVIETLKERGCVPFIVPAMGSHGGATEEGQIGILADYGVTEASMGAPIRATMEVVQVGTLDEGYPVYFDRFALEADAVLVINRVKAHTDFHGEIESGLGKMCAIGLGKQKGADSIHRFGAQGLREIMPQVARRLVQSAPIVGGIALIENPYGQTAEIHGLPGAELANVGEKALLDRARRLLPRLPFAELDALILDEMGKEIAGSGMDTHVIGRLQMPSLSEADWDGPSVRLLGVLALTPASHGNAAGLGLADIVTHRLIESVNFHDTLLNSRTSGEGGVLRGRIPLIVRDAEMVVRTAIATCGRGRWEEVRLARIRSTKYVNTLEVTEALLPEVRANPALEIVIDRHFSDWNRPLEQTATL